MSPPDMPDFPAADAAGMMDLMTRLWPLHRTLVCDDMDRSMEIIGEFVPKEFDYQIHGFPSGQKIWTWSVPEKYEVEEAYLELITPDGPRRVVDFADDPLHIVSYSPPIDREMDFAELEPHLHSNPDVPTGIPWVFKFYDRDWGFCLRHETLETLPRDGRYRAVIRSRFSDGLLRVGELNIPGKSDDCILFVCDVCHPSQVNDSIAGVVTAVDLANRLADRTPGHYGIKMLFLPETVGSIAYLANNEDVIERCKFGIYGEMFGHDGPMRLQRTRQDTHLLDKVAHYVLQRRFGDDFEEGPFCYTIITNDEKVTNAPGVDIPTIALNRWPYALYHTSEDTPAAMNPERLVEVSDIYLEMVEILQTNFYPRRRFRGPLFLSGLDLDFDWKATRKLKRAVQDVMGNLEGDLSAFDLAVMVDLDYATTLKLLQAMRTAGVVDFHIHNEPIAAA